MFTMMNNARLLVGVHGVGMAERATQMAVTFARERKQGRAPGRNHGQNAIIEVAGAAQLLRDARILPIYEGTNGIQAADLVIRRIRLDLGVATAALFENCANLITEISKQDALRIASFKLQNLLATMVKHTAVIVNSDLSHALLHSACFLRGLSATIASAYLLEAAGQANTAQPVDMFRPLAFCYLFSDAAGEVARLTASLEMPTDIA